MVTTSLPPLLRATALATTTLLGNTRLIENRLDLARRIIQHTLNLVHLVGLKSGRHLLNALNKFPVQVITNLFPYLVMRDQTIAGFEQRKEDLVLIEI